MTFRVNWNLYSNRVSCSFMMSPLFSIWQWTFYSKISQSKHQVLILWFPCVPDVFKLQLGVNNKRYFVSADRTINCSCFMKLSTITELHKYPIQQRIQAITHYLLQQSENWWNEVSHGRAQPSLQPATEARRHNQQYSWTIIMAGRWQDHIVHHTHKLKMTSTESISLEKTWWPQLQQTNCQQQLIWVPFHRSM